MSSPPRIPDVELLRRIGGGSYGEVWLARTVTGLYRAVKIVDRARFADDRPFLRELDGITRFQRTVGNRPRQLALLHVGRDDEQGLLYYVMELADDVEREQEIDPATYEPLTLKALHARRPVLPVSEAVMLGVALTRILAELHGARLIHRDVKPSNIIFVQGVPKLADLGLVSSLDHTNTSLGTPGYAPPEGAGTVSADLFGLGKILYELSTGLSPDEFPRLPAETASRADAAQLLELNEVFLRACHRDPAQRYAIAEEMLDDLTLLQAGKSVRELVRTRERVRHLSRVVVLLGAAAVVAAAAFGVQRVWALKRFAEQETVARLHAESDERLARYSADLHLAQLAVSGGDIGVARTALRRQIPTGPEQDLRGTEWQALWGDTAGDANAVLGQPGGPSVRALALSPDGRFLATQEGEASRNVMLVDLPTGTRRKLASATYGLGGFNAGGTQLAVGTAGRNLQVLAIPTGNVVAEHPIGARLAAASDQGRILVFGETREAVIRLRLWDQIAGSDAATWQFTKAPLETILPAVTISDDGRWLATAVASTQGMRRDREVSIWDVAKRETRFTRTDLGSVQALRFSPDGAFLAVGRDAAPTLVLDGVTGETQAVFAGHQGRVSALEFSEDGSMLATAGSDQKIRIWDRRTGGLIETRRGHERDVTALCRVRGSSAFYSAGEDGTVRRWDVPGARRIGTIPGFWREVLGDVVFASDGRELAVTDETGAVAFVDTDSGTIIARNPGVFQPLSFVEGGKTLLALTASRALARVNRDTGEVGIVSELALPAEGRASSSELSANGKRAAFGLSDGSVEVWDLAAATRLGRWRPHTKPVRAIALHPDGRIASGDSEGKVVLSRSDGTNVTPVGSDSVSVGAVGSLAFAPTGELLIGGSDGTITVWDLPAGTARSVLRAHSRPVLALSYVPDGSRLVGGGNDRVLTFWSPENFRQVGMIPVDGLAKDGQNLGVCRVRFAADGSKMAVLTEDGHLRIWTLSR